MFLDSDLAGFQLAELSPIDEFAYTVPAFNLIHYGTWTHQAAAWAPLEGWPMNVLQNLVAWVTLRIGGNSYEGLRASSVIFALAAFLAIWALVRGQVRETVRTGLSPRASRAIEVLAVTLLLVDFAFVVAARSVEPTVSRVAVVALLLLAVQRGGVLREQDGAVRMALLGGLVAISVWFVYVYNLFLLPAVLAAVIIVSWWRAGRRQSLTAAAAYCAGALAGTAAYFGFVATAYGQSPADWYRVWIAGYGSSARFGGISLTNVASMLDANSFRFDAPLLLVALLGLPVFAWWALHSRQPWAVLAMAMLGSLIVQSAVVADYPYKKFLVLLALAVPIAAIAIQQLGRFLAWLRGSRERTVAGAAYAGLITVIWIDHLTGLRLVTDPLLTRVVQAAAVLFVVAGIALAVGPRRLRTTLIVAMALAVLLPLAYADWRHVYGHRAYTYRDALVAARPDLDGRVTAGDLSFAMQLYTTAAPVLEGYVYGITQEAYIADVVRAFDEGDAAWLFAYTTPAIRSKWEAAGFVLVETYPIKLPNGLQLGRFLFSPGAPSR